MIHINLCPCIYYSANKVMRIQYNPQAFPPTERKFIDAPVIGVTACFLGNDPVRNDPGHALILALKTN